MIQSFCSFFAIGMLQSIGNMFLTQCTFDRLSDWFTRFKFIEWIFPRKLHTNFHTYLVSFVSHLGSKGKQMHCVSNTNGPLLIHEHFKRSVYVQFCFEIIMSLHLFHMYRLNFISFLDYFSRFNALNEIDCLPFPPI